ncbi:nuclear transport factor 2 family protein [Kutzneria kofuensis]|uniref:Ketosteroid isomerase-like protein n=1 Tax=Kutzneria kofuensis TaxID=103725 RepID=A0A7W9KE99_9PSEU|nr:nuclear transport factor 2 family protein [Kutzneria kofuensis]MBB5890951.1 ketosteroid isomerase-like protein [Kutzneria kofuensis]
MSIDYQTANSTLTQQIQQFVADWYRALDRHRPWAEIEEYLDDEVRFVFPETTVDSHQGLHDWYDVVTHKFFDEAHRVDLADVQITGDTARVHVLVNWRTRIWNAPDPDSAILEYEADQDWIVGIGADGRIGLRDYVVNGLEPRGDTPPLT